MESNRKQPATGDHCEEVTYLPERSWNALWGLTRFIRRQTHKPMTFESLTPTKDGTYLQKGDFALLRYSYDPMFPDEVRIGPCGDRSKGVEFQGEIQFSTDGPGRARIVLCGSDEARVKRMQRKMMRALGANGLRARVPSYDYLVSYKPWYRRFPTSFAQRHPWWATAIISVVAGTTSSLLVRALWP